MCSPKYGVFAVYETLVMASWTRLKKRNMAIRAKIAVDKMLVAEITGDRKDTSYSISTMYCSKWKQFTQQQFFKGSSPVHHDGDCTENYKAIDLKPKETVISATPPKLLYIRALAREAKMRDIKENLKIFPPDHVPRRGSSEEAQDDKNVLPGVEMIKSLCHCMSQ